jgi:hypothetical protein
MPVARTKRWENDTKIHLGGNKLWEAEMNCLKIMFMLMEETFGFCMCLPLPEHIFLGYPIGSFLYILFIMPLLEFFFYPFFLHGQTSFSSMFVNKCWIPYSSLQVSFPVLSCHSVNMSKKFHILWLDLVFVSFCKGPCFCIIY